MRLEALSRRHGRMECSTGGGRSGPEGRKRPSTKATETESRERTPEPGDGQFRDLVPMGRAKERNPTPMAGAREYAPRASEGQGIDPAPMAWVSEYAPRASEGQGKDV